MEKVRQNRFIIVNFLILLGIFLLNFAFSQQEGDTSIIKKRGYILDRNFLPIAISVESYRAYYLLNKSELGGKIPEEVKKYLPDILTLPEKGIILLAKNLNLEEAQRLKKEKNVILQRDFKRKILFPFLEPLIGKTFNGRGVSGIEKVFDEKLKRGEFIVLSLDTKLEEKLARFVKRTALEKIAILIFNTRTGELLGYFQKNNPVLKKYYPLSDFNISPAEVSDFSWELGKQKIIYDHGEIKITLMHFVNWIFGKLCKNVKPTILYKRSFRAKSLRKACHTENENFRKELEKTKIYELEKDVIITALKGDKLVIIDFLKDQTLQNKNFPDIFLTFKVKRFLVRL
jgi:cell division protein FtsI/penicillin-binding protein 2